MFGEQPSSVLHSHVQSASVQLHDGDAELKRLVINWVEVPLEGAGFPASRPAFVWEQIQTHIRVRAMICERDQVSARMYDHDESVPLGAVSDGELDLPQREVTGARAIV